MKIFARTPWYGGGLAFACQECGRYCAGPEDCDGKDDKIGRMISAISDCRGVLALRIGDSPAERLKGRHITPIATYDRIESAVNRAAQQLC